MKCFRVSTRIGFRVLVAVFVIGQIGTNVTFANDDEFEVLEHDIVKLALPKAKIGIKQAIEAAAKDAGDAKLAEAELSVDGDMPVFELGFLADSGAIEINVDAITGKVLKRDEEKSDSDEADEYKEALKGLNASKFTVIQAIDAAINEVKGGTVVGAEAGVEHGNFGFTVEVASGDQFKEVHFDANGKLTKTQTESAQGQAWIFDHEEAGKTPAGWKFGYTNPAEGKGSWMIAKDAKAMSGPHVLTLDAKSGGGTFNLAMAEKTSYQDVDVRTRIRANAGKEDQGGGLIWRAKDENNYYVCRLNPLESNFRVYKVISGKRQQLQGAEFKAEAGKWHIVRAKMVGNRIMCFVGDRKLLDVTDDEIKTAGMIGLWTKADASSSFDNIAVMPGRLSDRDSKKSDQPGGSQNKDDDDGDE